MYCGVGKSGSPAPKPMTGRPAAFSALALASTASVADSAMAPRRAETRAETGVGVGVGVRAGCDSWRSVTRSSWQIGQRDVQWFPTARSAGSTDGDGPAAGFDQSAVTTYTRPLVVDDRHDESCPQGALRPRACAQRNRLSSSKGSGAIGSAPVSKTGGCGFESLLPCASGRRIPGDAGGLAVTWAVATSPHTSRDTTVSESAPAAASGAGRAAATGANKARSKGPAKRSLSSRLALFVRQVVAELKKVVRPTRQELITYTGVVLAFVGAVMAFVAILDVGIGRLVLWVFGG